MNPIYNLRHKIQMLKDFYNYYRPVPLQGGGGGGGAVKAKYTCASSVYRQSH